MEITKHILEDSIAIAKAQGAVRIREIHLALGAFCGLVPACIQMYMDVLAKGTMAEEVKIIAHSIPLRVECLDCHTVAQIDRHHIECPHCHSLRLKRLSGRECMIERLEVDIYGDQGLSSDHGVE